MNFDVVVIGGGPAGMAAALEAERMGSKTLLVERDDCLGGVLNQCIHLGFGVHFFGEEMTGPEYAEKFVKRIRKSSVTVMLSTFVTKVSQGCVEMVSRDGAKKVQCKSIILAMGCRERTAGSIMLPGSRPTGVFTAGQVQKLVNSYGKLPCKKPIILGSGDVGLIMARRMAYEGAKPLMVLEISKNTGLARNISQCLEDYEIPLLLSTTIVEVVGNERVEGVFIASVDEKFVPIESTKRFVECDGVILSVGMVPENDLVPFIEFNPCTNGAVVNEFHETSIRGIFSCGNVLHVHDLVDFVSREAEVVGKFASLNSRKKLVHGREFSVIPGNGVRYTLPNTVFAGEGEVSIFFRVKCKFVKTNILAMCNGKIIAKKFVISANSGEMQNIAIKKSDISGDITIEMEERL